MSEFCALGLPVVPEVRMTAVSSSARSVVSWIGLPDTSIAPVAGTSTERIPTFAAAADTTASLPSKPYTTVIPGR